MIIEQQPIYIPWYSIESPKREFDSSLYEYSHTNIPFEVYSDKFISFFFSRYDDKTFWFTESGISFYEYFSIF